MTNIELASHLELLANDIPTAFDSVILRDAAIRLRGIKEPNEYPKWEGNAGEYRGYCITIENINSPFLLNISKGPIMQYVGWVDGSIFDARADAIEWIDREFSK